MGKRKHSGGKSHKPSKARFRTRYSKDSKDSKSSDSGKSAGSTNSQSQPEQSVSEALRDANSVLFEDCVDPLENSVFEPGNVMDGQAVDTKQSEVSDVPTNANIVKLLENITVKLTHVETKLNSLDNLNKKVSNMESDLSKLWNLVQSNSVSQQDSLNKLSDKVDNIELALASAQSSISTLQREKDELQNSLSYMQAQSMRNNLLFSGIREDNSESPGETETVLRKFLIDKLKLAKEKVDELRFERVHRTGGFSNAPTSKPRSIVAKFTYFQDRETVRRASPALKNTGFYINEQFPKDVVEKRKALQPQLRRAREAGKRAWIRYDTLYIDGAPVRTPSMAAATNRNNTSA